MTTNKLVFLSRLGSSVALWTGALWIIFSGYELGFFFLISTLALVGLWEYYTILEHKKLPNFKIIGMLSGGVLVGGGFYYCSRVGPARSYDFEIATLVFFMLIVFARQMFQKTRSACAGAASKASTWAGSTRCIRCW